jgi:nickel-dependent lactate racemase
MTIRLAYGKGGLMCTVPEKCLAGVLAMPPAKPLADPVQSLRNALKSPIGGKPLAEIASRGGKACVVICDITRPVPNTLILPPVLETLEQHGIRREDITILIATGLHRPSTNDERRAMLGDRIARMYKVVDHRARVAAEQEYLGTTRRGTAVYIDRVYSGADLKVTTGFIEPHLMAGFSGGRKMVAPGCAGEETIKALHSPLFLENPRCCEGSIEGNPLHDELLEIAAMAGHDFIVNVALDDAHAVTGVFAGDPLRAHAAGVAHVRGSVGATLKGPADIVVTTSAGYPLDLTFYQAIKGATAALPVVKEGGVLILAAECAEGMGSPEFTAMATRFPDAEAFTRSIMASPVIIDQWQLEECAKAARHAEVILVSPRLHREFGGKLFVRTAATLDDAFQRGKEKLGPDASIAVIPQGPYTLVSVL